MVDDHTQRPFRANEPPAPGASKAQGKASGSDPLAELARLIGQNDPFAEFGRDGARRVAAPQPIEPAPEWDAQPEQFGQAAAPAQAPDLAAHNYYNAPPAPQGNFGRQQFGGAPLATDAEHYQAEHEVPGYPPLHASQTTVSGYEDDAYRPGAPQLGPEQEDFYDDVQPSRRRMGILVIAGIFALSVIGTAGAFGYRAIFGSSSTSVPPPVIKADSAPSKIVPASAKDAQSSKQITDRVNDKGIGEKLVSREEKPVDVEPRPPGAGMAQDAANPNGSGVVGSEPKKVRTIPIRPDQQASAEPPPASAPAGAAPPARVTAMSPAKPAVQSSPARTASNPPAEAEPEARQAVTRAAPQAAEAPSRNAPLSLNPDAPTRSAPARTAPAKRTAAAVAPVALAPTAASGGGGYAVQVSSQRSEADAQAAFRSLQAKYPGQLGGKQPLIRRADLGAKGIYFRAMVGPFATGGEAGELCSSLKAAGGSCIVQKN